MRYGDLYRRGEKILSEAGIEEAAVDARLLLEFVTGQERNTLFAHPDLEVSQDNGAKYEEYLAKRAKRVPLQYITRRQSFMGLSFSVNENVLIPRQDTEILVEEVMREPFDGSRILDICSGSGCILLSLLHYSNDSIGVGLEISPKAIEIAEENAALLELKERAIFLESDLLEKAEGKFDIIVANPPYIKTDVIKELMPEVKNHEPVLALDGGEDGLLYYEEILSGIGAFAKGGTRLYFEIGYDQGEAVSRLMKDSGFAEVKVIQDYAGLDRVVCGRFTCLTD